MKLTLVSFVSYEMKDPCLLSREDMAVTTPLRNFRLLSGRNRRARVEVGARFGMQGSQGHARKECSEQRYTVGNV